VEIGGPRNLVTKRRAQASSREGAICFPWIRAAQVSPEEQFAAAIDATRLQEN
jgi:hypothetical protein